MLIDMVAVQNCVFRNLHMREYPSKERAFAPCTTETASPKGGRQAEGGRAVAVGVVGVQATGAHGTPAHCPTFHPSRNARAATGAAAWAAEGWTGACLYKQKCGHRKRRGPT